MLTYKRGDTIALVAPLLLNKVAQPGTGWSGFGHMRLLGTDDAPLVSFAFSWVQTAPAGIARFYLDTTAVPEGQYETEVALRRDSDGFTLTSQTERINIIKRVGALPA
ncbi:MAG: hypothetical protein Q7K57_25115 [Burkholderiaceae bacterium]|nr:hypothetical protein [Burkholderiaceae bacterium]